MEEELKRRIFRNSPSPQDGPVIDSLRQKNLLEQAYSGVEKVLEGIHNGLPVDVLAMDLSEVLLALGKLQEKSPLRILWSRCFPTSASEVNIWILMQ